jgi:hypothetical protein
MVGRIHMDEGAEPGTHGRLLFEVFRAAEHRLGRVREVRSLTFNGHDLLVPDDRPEGSEPRGRLVDAVHRSRFPKIIGLSVPCIEIGIPIGVRKQISHDLDGIAAAIPPRPSG